MEHWQIRKPTVTSSSGLVAAQHVGAARLGAEVLARGGNAVDGAVATAFALGVCEPWLSGIGGGGIMVIHLAAEQETHVVDFGMVTPASLDPARYSLREGTGQGLFAWPAVDGDRNLKGYESICVPGTVDGLGLALERFGTIDLATALEPAIALASEGLPVDWYATLSIALESKPLATFPATRAIFLPEGLPPATSMGAPLARLDLGNLAATLRRLAAGGRREFYEGDTADAIVRDVRGGGGALNLGDLTSYRARVVAPLRLDYRDVTLNVPPGLTGGQTFVDALRALEGATFSADGEPTGKDFLHYARALRDAYAARFETMGHAGSAEAPSCTSHLSVVDRAGNMVSLTNTLLARFGSKVVLPETSVLMNNGTMWFDPRPGRPNSIAPGRRPLANMCPVLGTRDGAACLAIGGAGGRRIIPAVVQLVSFLIDFGLPIDTAFDLPRIDLSDGRTVACDARLPDEVVATVAAELPVTRQPPGVYPPMFAVPSAVVRDTRTGLQTGAAHPYSPWAGVASVDHLET